MFWGSETERAKLNDAMVSEDLGWNGSSCLGCDRKFNPELNAIGGCQVDEEGQVAKIRHGESLDDHIRFFDGL